MLSGRTILAMVWMRPEAETSTGGPAPVRENEDKDVSEACGSGHRDRREKHLRQTMESREWSLI